MLWRIVGKFDFLKKKNIFTHSKLQISRCVTARRCVWFCCPTSSTSPCSCLEFARHPLVKVRKKIRTSPNFRHSHEPVKIDPQLEIVFLFVREKAHASFFLSLLMLQHLSAGWVWKNRRKVHFLKKKTFSGMEGRSEPYAEEAKFFVEQRLLQQDVQVGNKRNKLKKSNFKINSGKWKILY